MWASLQNYLKIFLLFLSNHLYGTMMHRVIARLLYLPTVLKLLLLRGPNSKWYSRVDDTVILGALPFRNQTKEVQSMNIDGMRMRLEVGHLQIWELGCSIGVGCLYRNEVIILVYGTGSTGMRL